MLAAHQFRANYCYRPEATTGHEHAIQARASGAEHFPNPHPCVFASTQHLSMNAAASSETVSSREIRPFAWPLLLLFLVLATAISIFGWFYHEHQRKQALETAYQFLGAVADLKVGQITTWRNNRLSEARLFAGAAFVARDVETFLADPASETARQKIMDWLTLLVPGERYSQVALYDAQLRERVALVPWPEPPGPLLQEPLATVFRSGEVLMTDLYHDAAGGAIHLDIILPVFPTVDSSTRNPRPRPIVAILLRLDPSLFLFPLIESWPTASPTAETSLVRRDGADVLYLNELRHRKGTALALRLPLDYPDLLAAKALLGETGFQNGVDYRGERVVGAVRKIPDSSWLMVAELDEAELLAPLHQLALTESVAATAVLLAALLGVMLLWRQRITALLQNQLVLEGERSQLAKRLDYLISTSSMVIYTTEPSDYHIATFISKNITQITGYEQSEFIDVPGVWLGHIHPDDVGETLAIFDALYERGQILAEYRLRFKDGNYHWIQDVARVVRDAEGRPVEIVGTFTDITARKQAEMALRASDERFREIFEHSVTGIAITDLDGHFQQCNPAYCALLGYTEAELRQMVFSSLVYPEDRAANLAEIRRLIAGDLPYFEVENRYVHKGGGPVWVHKFVSILPDTDGKPAHLLALVTDIGKRKTSEIALRLSETQLRALAARLEAVREEERTRIASEVHDVLGQLMTGLSIDMAWLEKRLPKVTDPDLRQTMTDKLAEVRRLNDTIIRTVQEISSALRPSVLDNLGLDSAIRFEANRFQQRAEIACTAETPEAMPPLDRERATGLFRIFQEILTNVARHAQATQVGIRLAATSDSLVLEVRDNGRGIAPEEITSAKSLGLLSMRERAAQLGGRIDLAGEPGQGTTVTVTVPL